MRSIRRAVITALIAISAIGVATSTAAAVQPVWKYGTLKTILKAGETKTTTLTGGKFTAEIPTFPAITLKIECKKSAGTGSVIGGEPGKGKVTITLAECTAVSGTNPECKVTVSNLPNISSELVILKDGKTITENLTFPSGSGALTFFTVEDPLEYKCGGLQKGAYKILFGTVPGLVGTGEALELPKKYLEAAEGEPAGLEFSGARTITEFKDTFTQKLTNGEKLFAELH